jgi:hypothetical protein
MDFSNIQALLTKTVATGLGDLLHGVELGNELIKGYVHAGQMAKDFTTLSGIVKTLWSGRTKVPILAGADEGRNMPAFLKALKPNVLTAATFHQYGQCGHYAVSQLPSFLSRLSHVSLTLLSNFAGPALASVVPACLRAGVCAAANLHERARRHAPGAR